MVPEKWNRDVSLAILIGVVSLIFGALSFHPFQLGTQWETGFVVNWDEQAGGFAQLINGTRVELSPDNFQGEAGIFIQVSPLGVIRNHEKVNPWTLGQIFGLIGLVFTLFTTILSAVLAYGVSTICLSCQRALNDGGHLRINYQPRAIIYSFDFLWPSQHWWIEGVVPRHATPRNANRIVTYPPRWWYAHSDPYDHFTVNVVVTTKPRSLFVKWFLCHKTPFVLDGTMKTTLRDIPSGCVLDHKGTVTAFIAGVKLHGVPVVPNLPHNILGYDVLAYWEGATYDISDWRSGWQLLGPSKLMKDSTMLGELVCVAQDKGSWVHVDSGNFVGVITKGTAGGATKEMTVTQFDGAKLTTSPRQYVIQDKKTFLIGETNIAGADLLLESVGRMGFEFAKKHK